MDISTLSIPSNKIKQFQGAGINTLEDLLLYFPKQYAYYGQVTAYNEFPQKIGEVISICGTVESVTTSFRNVIYVTAVVKNKSGQSINVVWFNQRHIGNLVYTGMFLLAHGKLSYNEKYQSYSLFPDYYCTDINHFNDIIPVYKKIPGMSNDYIRSCIKTVLDTVDYKELFQDQSHIDDSLAKKVGVCDLRTVLHLAHFPKTKDDCERVKQWETADVLAAFAIEMAIRKKQSSSKSNFVLNHDAAQEAQKRLAEKLPYSLTQDQASAVANMTSIMCSKKRLNALLQGDVGCGKTIVAFMMAAALKEMNVSYTPTLMLYGDSGTGKTMLAKYIAYRAGVPYLYVRFSGLINSYLGKTQENLNNIFTFAKQQPCVLCIDEIDTIAMRRGQRSDVGEMNRIVISLMQEMDQLPNDLIVVGTTNRFDQLDDAMVRRFTVIQEIKPFSFTDACALLRKFFGFTDFDMTETQIQEWVKERFCKSIYYPNALIKEATQYLVDSIIQNDSKTKKREDAEDFVQNDGTTPPVYVLLEEVPEIMGSGSSSREVLKTSDLEKALDMLARGKGNTLIKRSRINGNMVELVWNEFKTRFE